MKGKSYGIPSVEIKCLELGDVLATSVFPILQMAAGIICRFPADGRL